MFSPFLSFMDLPTILGSRCYRGRPDDRINTSTFGRKFYCHTHIYIRMKKRRKSKIYYAPHGNKRVRYNVRDYEPAGRRFLKTIISYHTPAPAPTVPNGRAFRRKKPVVAFRSTESYGRKVGGGRHARGGMRTNVQWARRRKKVQINGKIKTKTPALEEAVPEPAVSVAYHIVYIYIVVRGVRACRNGTRRALVAAESRPTGKSRNILI